MGTSTPTLKPASIPIPAPTPTNNPTELSPTSNPSSPPTVDQLDGSICCQCLEAANNENKVKGCPVDPQCQSIICDFDGYCCSNLWDKTCTFYASEQCGKTIPATTETVAAAQAVTDLDLIWKFALVVFAFVVVAVGCCCSFIFMSNCFKKCCKKKKTNQLKKKKKENEVV